MTTKEALDALLSTKCHCGAAKKSRMSHCRRCYFSLPLKMRHALYKKIRTGYEEAYEQSCQWLDAKRATAGAV